MTPWKNSERKFLNGKLPFGKILPPEIELADLMKVSRPTIAKVYNALQKEGLVKKRQGLWNYRNFQ